MKQLIKKQPRSTASGKPEHTVGLDLGDRYSQYCVLSGAGELVEEGPHPEHRSRAAEAIRRRCAHADRARSGHALALGQPSVE